MHSMGNYEELSQFQRTRQSKLSEHELDNTKSQTPSLQSDRTLHEAHDTFMTVPLIRSNELPTSKARTRSCWNIWGFRSQQKWKLGLYIGLMASWLVFIANLVLLLISVSSHEGVTDGIGTIARGTSKEIDRLSTVYHIAINLLSTVLLVSSNYAMQVLCAPTRNEIEQAHRQSHSLQIGLLSLHNLRFISKARVLLWWTLLLSSFPLHLLYNSTMFSISTGQEYHVTFISIANVPERAKNWSELQNGQWLHAYSTKYVSGYRDLYLTISEVMAGVYEFSNRNVTTCFDTLQIVPTNCEELISNYPSDSTNLAVCSPWADGDASNFTSYNVTIGLYDDHNGQIPSNLWSEYGITGISESMICPSGWMNAYPIKIAYGLAEPTSHQSQIQVAIPFLVIVIVSNALKSVAIYLTIRWVGSSHILTVGDAIASFVEEPEPHTVGRCLVTRLERVHGYQNNERPWRGSINRYTSTLGGRRIGTILLCLCALVLDITALTAVVPTRPKQGKWTHGWGTASKAILPFTPAAFNARSVLLNAFVANTPQVLLSFVYFGMNRICTSSCFAYEWNSFGQQRKTLRVSAPCGTQRPTYFLQLPYRWAIPLAATSGFLHWLLSQSIFLVRVEHFDYYGNRTEDSRSVCGYSPSAFLVFSVVFTLFLLLHGFLLLRLFKVNLPIAAHSSKIISAACHPPPGDTNAHLQPIQWGVVKNRFGGDIDHCTFTSEDVSRPVEGKYYA